MTRWQEMVVFYASSHRHPVNIAVHVVGVPVIVCSVLVAAAWLRIPLGDLTLPASWIVAAAGLAYYFSLDRIYAAIYAPFLVGLVLLANELATLPFETAAAISAGGFFGGYAAQFLGHAIEGRKPALFQSLWKAMATAPLFVVAEVCKFAGYRKDEFATVLAEIERREAAAAN